MVYLLIRFHSASAITQSVPRSQEGPRDLEIRIHPAINKSMSEECLGTTSHHYPRARLGSNKRVSAPIAREEVTEDSTLDEVRAAGDRG